MFCLLFELDYFLNITVNTIVSTCSLSIVFPVMARVSAIFLGIKTVSAYQ